MLYLTVVRTMYGTWSRTDIAGLHCSDSLSSTPLLHPHQRHKADLTSAMLQCSESELTAAHHRQTSLLTKNFRFLKYIHTKQLGIEIYEFFILQLQLSDVKIPSTVFLILGVNSFQSVSQMN